MYAPLFSTYSARVAGVSYIDKGITPHKLGLDWTASQARSTRKGTKMPYLGHHQSRLYYAMMLEKPFHVMTGPGLDTICGKTLDRDKWWFVTHRPLTRMCATCRRGRGRFETQKDVLQQTNFSF